eukprot:5700511-Alexandrium_andersonii.AAC.1
MSASLVGSEMCIRDSSKSAFERIASSEIRCRELLRSSPTTEVGRQPDESVSYTHLTLPTICSV